MTRIDYHALSDRQRLVLVTLRAAPEGLNTSLLAEWTGLTNYQAKSSAESLRKRGHVIVFTYRGGAQVWRIAPEDQAQARAEFLTPPGTSRP